MVFQVLLQKEHPNLKGLLKFKLLSPPLKLLRQQDKDGAHNLRIHNEFSGVAESCWSRDHTLRTTDLKRVQNKTS